MTSQTATANEFASRYRALSAFTAQSPKTGARLLCDWTIVHNQFVISIYEDSTIVSKLKKEQGCS
jgi:hypothetical protein